MPTVKIKTEPAAVDVQVKLEPSLSTADIELEQHSSDVDAKVESDSEADNDVKSESDSDGDASNGNTNQNQFTITPKKRRQFICEHPDCGRSFGSAKCLKMHQHEHRLQTERIMYGKTYILTRQSLNSRWPCPIPNCASTYKTVSLIRNHIQTTHGMTLKQQHQEQHQSPAQMAQCIYYFFDVDDFYVNGIRCGYNSTIGVFICHECRLVPECMLTHLQQKHGHDGKSIDNSTLPESAANANVDPCVNQHTSNTHLAAAIRQPHWKHHQDIFLGWICVTSDCGYCGYTVDHKSDHKRKMHNGEQVATVPALVLRLSLSKIHSSCFLIVRLDTVINRVNQHKLDYNHSGLNTQDENGDETEQYETTDVSIQKQKWKCEYHNCGLVFNSNNQLRTHRREHKLEVVANVRGTPFTLSRKSADDRWTCPFPNCETTYTSIRTTHMHIKNVHHTLVKQKRTKSEDDVDQQQQQQQQQQIVKRRQHAVHFLKVNGFYIGGTRYGYHTAIGVFLCHECRLVPDCLLTHLQQKHGFDEMSIDNPILPERARMVGSDPDINQHIDNPHLAAAIRDPYQQQHQDIFQGWLCVTSDCGHCCSTEASRNMHQYREHKGKQKLTVPALVLRLLYGKVNTSCYLITRLDTAANNIKPSNSTSPYNKNFHIDDGDELVLSDYGDEDELVLSDMGDDDETTI